MHCGPVLTLPLTLPHTPNHNSITTPPPQSNMRCFLENDNLLFLLRDEVFGDEDEGEDEDDVKGIPEAWGAGTRTAVTETSTAQAAVSCGGIGEATASAEVLQLRAQLAQYSSFVDSLVNAPDKSRTKAAAAEEGSEKDSGKPVRQDDYYFESYAGISIHETMLRDRARTTSYANAMLINTAYFKGKVVLDVGCGTGILSMVAARAWAKKVVGVDESSILDYTRKIVAKNGFSDVITLVQGRIEETPLPLEEDEVPAALSHTLTRTLLFDLYISVFDPH